MGIQSLGAINKALKRARQNTKTQWKDLLELALETGAFILGPSTTLSGHPFNFLLTKDFRTLKSTRDDQSTEAASLDLPSNASSIPPALLYPSRWLPVAMWGSTVSCVPEICHCFAGSNESVLQSQLLLAYLSSLAGGIQNE